MARSPFLKHASIGLDRYPVTGIALDSPPGFPTSRDFDKPPESLIGYSRQIQWIIAETQAKGSGFDGIDG
jgi:hypothetical protein